MKKILPFTIAIFNLMISLTLLGGLSGSTVLGADDPACFFINVNKLGENKVVELPLTTICLDYEDRYGKQDHLKMRIFNWENEIIESIDLEKAYGKNSYTIDLKEYGISDNNEIYHLIFHNEYGKEYSLSFRITPPAEKPDPIVNIFVNPVLLECKSPEGNLVEFYGSIEGGKAPYEIRWVLLESNYSSLLYKPEEMKVQKAGYTPTIQIDKSPDYVVMLEVKDACGNEGKQIVNVECKNNLDKASSIFVQPVPKFEEDFIK